MACGKHPSRSSAGPLREPHPAELRAREGRAGDSKAASERGRKEAKSKDICLGGLSFNTAQGGPSTDARAKPPAVTSCPS